MVLWLVVLILFSSPALAEPFVGLSAFSGLSLTFPCDDYVETAKLPKSPGMAVLFGTFGKDWSCVEAFVDAVQDRPHLLEVHLSNETCRRRTGGRFCDVGELNRGDSVSGFSRRLESKDKRLTRDVIRRVRAIRGSVERVRAPSTVPALSTGLEDNYTAGAYRYILSLIRREWPYAIVENPVGNPRGGADLVEYHGLRSPPSNRRSIYNNDGTELSLRALLELYERSQPGLFGLFYWDGTLQGLRDGSGFIPVSERRYRLTAKARRTFRRLVAHTQN